MRRLDVSFYGLSVDLSDCQLLAGATAESLSWACTAFSILSVSFPRFPLRTTHLLMKCLRRSTPLRYSGTLVVVHSHELIYDVAWATISQHVIADVTRSRLGRVHDYHVNCTPQFIYALESDMHCLTYIQSENNCSTVLSHLHWGPCMFTRSKMLSGLFTSPAVSCWASIKLNFLYF